MKRKNVVLIPAHQAAWCLEECIEAISRQTVKPNLVLIGVDHCPETLVKAVEIKEKHDKTDKRRKGTLAIEVFYFSQHCYPYRVRNTLAMQAPADAILHFFDADDIMYPEHIEMMAKALNTGRYMGATAECQHKPGGKPEPWERAHGVISIIREVFLQVGGFEPWRCAADTESHIRLQAAGLTKCKPKAATFLVRKHEGGLTAKPDTGYESDIRRAYKAEIIRRQQLAEELPQRDSVAIGHFKRYAPGDDLRLVIADQGPQLPPDPVLSAILAEEPEPGDSPLEQALEKCYVALRYSMRVHGKGLNNRTRAAYKMMQEALEYWPEVAE